jgi:hypothetical protein
MSASQLAELANTGLVVTVYKMPAFRIERINNASLDNPSAKAEDEGKERYFSVNVNPETLTEVKNGRQRNKGRFGAPGIEEFENGFDEELRDGFDDEI